MWIQILWHFVWLFSRNTSRFEHATPSAVVIQNDLLADVYVFNEQDFTRYQFKIIVYWTSYYATMTRESTTDKVQFL